MRCKHLSRKGWLHEAGKAYVDCCLIKMATSSKRLCCDNVRALIQVFGNAALQVRCRPPPVC